MIHLATNHGTGDTYMTLAFADAVTQHSGNQAVLTVPEKHAPIAKMFPKVYLRHDDAMGDMVHPSVRFVDASAFGYLDHAPTHADIWRVMLGLPRSAQMTRGNYLCAGPREPYKVFLLPETNSWRPQTWPEDFKVRLMDRLREAGWRIYVSGSAYSLDEVLYHCYTSEWVIGPQCGIMAILCHAKFPCRKTFVTPPSEIGHDAAMPVWRFSGDDYDVEEHWLLDPTKTVDRIMNGRHAARLPYTVEPSPRCLLPSTPGDMLDRLAVLTLKIGYLKGSKRVAVLREFHAVVAACATLNLDRDPELEKLLTQLIKVNDTAWHHNEISVTGMLENGRDLSHHFASAARFNKERVMLRNRINEIYNVPGREVKSYYGGDGTK